MKKQMKKQLIRRIIVIAIAVCVVLALVLPLFVKGDVAIGGDVNYQEADYYVSADGPDGSIRVYYGPGLEYGWDYELENGEILHISETADNVYDQLKWGRADSEEYYRWVQLDQTETVNSTLRIIIWRFQRLIREVLEYVRSFR